jgi:hypothetical protein
LGPQQIRDNPAAAIAASPKRIRADARACCELRNPGVGDIFEFEQKEESRLYRWGGTLTFEAILVESNPIKTSLINIRIVWTE